jgi:hypothetical protein
MKNPIPSHLSDEQLVADLKSVAGRERASTAQLVAHLAEMFPVVLDLLDDGSVNLITVRLLATHLTDENHRQLFGAATHLSKRDVEELVARIAPRPDVASSVRKVPVRRPSEPGAPPAPADDRGSAAPLLLPLGPSSTPTVAALPPRPPVVAPLAPDRYEVKFTVSAETREKPRRAQDLLRHAIPTGDPAEIFDRALTLLLEDVARKKFGATPRPRAARGVARHSRHFPAEVSRAVWLRDEERCAFVAKDGRRCGERGFLELHHLTPYGALGEATVDNIELRCRAHNQYESELFYGVRKDGDGGSEVRESAATYGRAGYPTRSGPSRPSIGEWTQANPRPIRSEVS